MKTMDEQGLIADKIARLNKEYKSRQISQDLQILTPYLQSMETLAVLKTVDKDSQPFALALVLGSLAIFKSKSQIGLIGPAFEKVLLSISKCIEAIDPSPSIGNKKLLNDGSQLVIAGIMTFSAIGASQGLAHSLYDEEAQKEINAFGLELLLHIGLYSNLPYYLFDNLLEVSKYEPGKKSQIACFLTLTSLLLAIWITAQEKGPKLETMVASLTPKLKEYFSKLETAFEDLSNPIIIALKQSIFALETANQAQFIEIANSVLALCEVSAEELTSDLKTICDEAKTLIGLLKSSSDTAFATGTEMWQTG